MSEAFVVRVEPLGVNLHLGPHQTVMGAAREGGYRWPTACQGKGICTLCHVSVEAGLENAVPPERWEIEKLRSVGLDPAVRRLACQLKVHGDLTVTKRGVQLLATRPPPLGPWNVVVDLDRCDNHANCTAAAPEVFEMDENDVLSVLEEKPANDLRPKVEEAVRQCPTGAISIADS